MYCEQLSKSVDGHMLFYVSWALINDTVIKLRVHCISALRNRKTLRISRAPNCWHASACRNFARLSWIDALFCSRFVYRSSYATLSTELLFIHDNFQLSKAMRRTKCWYDPFWNNSEFRNLIHIIALNFQNIENTINSSFNILCTSDFILCSSSL